MKKVNLRLYHPNKRSFMTAHNSFQSMKFFERMLTYDYRSQRRVSWTLKFIDFNLIHSKCIRNKQDAINAAK